MRSLSAIIIRTALAVFVIALVLFQQSAAIAQSQGATQRDPVFEQEIYDRLAAIDADAVRVFQSATNAMDADRLPEAKEDFESVLQLAPEFPDALRRLSYVESQLGNLDGAIALARRAVEATDTPTNQAALALALLGTEDPEDARQALQIIRPAAQAAPDDDYVNFVLLSAAIANVDVDAIRQSSDALIRLLPDNPVGHFYAGLVAADDGEWRRAEAELIRARELGWPAEEIEELLDEDISSNATRDRMIQAGIIAVVVWLGGMFVLFIAGAILSSLTLAATRRAQTTGEFTVGSGEHYIRNLYRAVIVLTSLYFYLSIPFLVLIVLGLSIGIFYAFLLLGRIPIRLVLILGLAALGTLYAVIRSVFVRVQAQEPGRPLPRSESPALWALAEEVAQRVGTRPIDAIFIVPGPTIAVTERGGFLKKMRGQGQRYLILGLAALDGMTQAQFKVILAHEYGHFSNRDTAGGGLALQVRVSMGEMARQLIVNGQARPYNPVWLFLNGFNRVFLRVTLGASRLQEILADRYAALAYGSRNFAEALTHIVRQSLLFDIQVNQEARQMIDEKRPINNIYTLPDLESDIAQKIDEAVEQQINRPTSAYDSHPAVHERIRLVEALDAPDPTDDGQLAALDLLANIEALQHEMSTTVQKGVERQVGVFIPRQSKR